MHEDASGTRKCACLHNACREATRDARSDPARSRHWLPFARRRFEQVPFWTPPGDSRSGYVPARQSQLSSAGGIPRRSPRLRGSGGPVKRSLTHWMNAERCCIHPGRPMGRTVGLKPVLATAAPSPAGCFPDFNWYIIDSRTQCALCIQCGRRHDARRLLRSPCRASARARAAGVRRAASRCATGRYPRAAWRARPQGPPAASAAPAKVWRRLRALRKTPQGAPVLHNTRQAGGHPSQPTPEGPAHRNTQVGHRRA